MIELRAHIVPNHPENPDRCAELEFTLHSADVDGIHPSVRLVVDVEPMPDEEDTLP